MIINFDNKTIEEWISDKEKTLTPPYEEMISKEKYSINGADGAVKVIYSTALGVNEENIVIPNIYGIIILSFPDTKESTNKAFEKVISTFKYI